jgi:hypothetical protein
MTISRARATPTCYRGKGATRRHSRAGGDQREPSFLIFEPRPLFLSGRGSKRGTLTAARSSRRDALLARQKRGASVARPRAITGKAWKEIVRIETVTPRVSKKRKKCLVSRLHW